MPMSNGDVAVVLWNDTTAAAGISTTAIEIGAPASGQYLVRNLWTGQTTTTTGTIAATVPAHGTVMYRVTASG